MAEGALESGKREVPGKWKMESGKWKVEGIVERARVPSCPALPLANYHLLGYYQAGTTSYIA